MDDTSFITKILWWEIGSMVMILVLVVFGLFMVRNDSLRRDTEILKLLDKHMDNSAEIDRGIIENVGEIVKFLKEEI